MVFLQPNHRFRNHHKNQFDGKVENKGPPMIMGPTYWLKKYEDVELKTWQDFFYGGDSIEEPKQVVIKMQKGMKRKFIFYELPYCKDILIYHLLYPMHILKNVSDSIFQHISGKEDTLYSRRDIALSRTKFDRNICGQEGKMKHMKKLHGF
jgi:hypothetical protein